LVYLLEPPFCKCVDRGANNHSEKNLRQKKRITNKQKSRKKENNTEEPRVALVALKYTIIQPTQKARVRQGGGLEKL